MTRLLLSVLLLALVVSPALAQKAPKIRASETGWDFGIRSQGDKESKTITIFNDGDEVLKINDIKITCGCVRGDLTQREIEPGKSAELELVLTTYGTVGKIRKHCYLFTNDPKMRQLVLTVDGEIRGDWELEKNQINFGNCEAGMSYAQKLRVIHRRGDLKFDRVECLDPNIEVKSEPFEEQHEEEQIDETTGEKRMTTVTERGWMLEVTLKETAPSGPFAAAVAVRTTHRVTPLQNLMVYARIEGPVRIQPLGKMHMGRVFVGAEARRNLKISIDDGNGYVVTDVKVDCPAVQVKLTELDPGVTWDAEFIVTGRKGDDNMSETIVITTSHPLQREIRMPLDWVTREAPAAPR